MKLMGIPNKISLHCTDSENGKDITVESIRKYHKSLGWGDIGYHYLIDCEGRLLLGRDIKYQGAHVKGANQGNIGIALFGRDKFTKPQFERLRGVINELTEKYKILPWEIYTHNEFDTAKEQGKTCPNIRGIELISYLHGYYNDALDKYLIKKENKTSWKTLPKLFGED